MSAPPTSYSGEWTFPVPIPTAEAEDTSVTLVYKLVASPGIVRQIPSGCRMAIPEKKIKKRQLVVLEQDIQVHVEKRLVLLSGRQPAGFPPHFLVQLATTRHYVGRPRLRIRAPKRKKNVKYIEKNHPLHLAIECSWLILRDFIGIEI